MRHLNRIYRNKDRPTDVLAFSQREGRIVSPNARLLGDVVVSVPTARRQAEARHRGLVAELTMLIAHGILHLLGWDHETPADDRRMRRETARLCAAAEGSTRASAAQGSPRRASPGLRGPRDGRRAKS
jgi:probable rRNA maturation factor